MTTKGVFIMCCYMGERMMSLACYSAHDAWAHSGEALV